MLLSFIYFVIIIFCGIYCKNTKLLNTILAVSLFLLFAFEHSDQDYEAYVNVYDSVGSGRILDLLGYEASYLMFCTLGNSYNLSFDAARAIVCVFEVLALACTIKVFNNKIALVIAMFMIFPATSDAELFRWLSGMCLTIFAVPYLIRAANVYDYIVYGVLIAFATFLHTSCLFFSLFYLLLIKDRKLLVTIVVSAFIVLFVTSQTSLLYKIIVYLPIDESLNDKFQQTGHSNIFGLLAITIRELPIILIGYMSYRNQTHNQTNTSITNKKFTLSRAGGHEDMGALLCSKIWNINIISILLIAVAIYTPQVQRLFHVVLFFNLVAVAYITEIKKNSKLIISTLSCCVIALLLHLNNGAQNVEIFLSHFKEGFLVNFTNWANL